MALSSAPGPPRASGLLDLGGASLALLAEQAAAGWSSLRGPKAILTNGAILGGGLSADPIRAPRRASAIRKKEFGCSEAGLASDGVSR